MSPATLLAEETVPENSSQVSQDAKPWYARFLPKKPIREYLTNVSVGLGLYNDFPLTTQAKADLTGGKNLFSPSPMFHLSGRFNIKDRHYFLPEYGYVYFLNTNDNFTKILNKWSLDFGYVLFDKYNLRYGVSTMVYSYNGPGGTVTMQDGSSTSSYALPKDANKTYNTTLDLGFEYQHNAHHGVRLDTHVFSILSDARQLSYNLSYHYYF